MLYSFFTWIHTHVKLVFYVLPASFTEINPQTDSMGLLSTITWLMSLGLQRETPNDNRRDDLAPGIPVILLQLPREDAIEGHHRGERSKD